MQYRTLGAVDDVGGGVVRRFRRRPGVRAPALSDVVGGTDGRV